MCASAHDAGQLRRVAPAPAPAPLLSLLSEIQDRCGYLPPSELILLSQESLLPLSQIYSVATFYHAFRLKPCGRHTVRVCMGTACHVRGAPLVLDRLKTRLGILPGDTTPDRNVTLETVNCLGACALGPITVVDGKYIGETDIARADRLLKNLAS